MNAYLIVGLGNPGAPYAQTRHNAGFMVLDALARELGVGWSEHRQANALVAELNHEGQKVILAKPQTYMNRSGSTVASLAASYGINPCQIWIVYDEASLPFGVLRIRQSGSAGGHNGVKSILESLGADDFVRFRLGIGEPPQQMALEDWVLSRFTEQELQSLERICTDLAKRMVEAFHGKLENFTENLAE